MTASEERFQASRLTINVLQRALNPAEHADIEAWIDLRSEEEGGFLWLAKALGVAPQRFDIGLRTLLHADPTERSLLRKRLLTFYNAVQEA